MMCHTDTSIAGVCNHADRRLGAFFSSLCGNPASETRNLGGWNPEEMERHYQKYSSISTILRLSGFSDGKRYHIPRANIDFDVFLKEYGEEHKAFFTSFMPWLDGADVYRGVKQLREEGFNAPANVHAALLYIRKVFFQDLYLYRKHSPELRLFSASIFHQYSATLDKWCAFCEEKVATARTFDGGDERRCSDVGHQLFEMLERRTANLEQASDKASAKLDRLLHLTQLSQESGSRPPKARRVPKKVKEGAPFQRLSLKPLIDMDIREVVEQWTVGFMMEESVWMRPLSEIDRSRVRRTIKCDKSLKNALLDRRKLYQHFKYQCQVHGGHEKAYEAIEELQKKVAKEYKPPRDGLCSLSRLLKHLKDTDEYN